jgi:nucleotide-binding universal stress UspA family protein
MLRLKKILVPTDFSTASDEALTSACQWGRSFGAEVHVLHVLQSLRPDLLPSPAYLSDPRSAPVTLREYADAELETRRQRAGRQGVAVECSAKEGLSAAGTILDYAQQSDVDLIAMSTHGRRGVRRMILGSVTEEVVQFSNLPVLTIVAGEPSAHPLRPDHILVPVDLSEHSKKAVAHAKHLAAAFGADLRLLHVVVEMPVPVYYDGTGFPGLAFTSPVLEKQAVEALECLYAEAEGPSVPVEFHLEHGLAVEQILRFSSTHPTDLMVLASHGLTGLSHLLMGSVAERLVRRASCPVFTVKSFGRSLLSTEKSPATFVGAAD